MLSVIVPARNAAATLPDTLAGLAEQGAEVPFEVIVVDDGSDDETGSIAMAHPAVASVLSLSGVGPAQARNAGAAAAKGDYLAFLDADCRPTPGWIAAGHQALGALDLVLGQTRPRPDHPLGPFDQTLSVVGCSPLFESANLFVRRELFKQLGGFESWLGPRGGKELGEDVWFGWRARRAGARIGACPEALAHHAVFGRGVPGFVAERWRLRFFPALAQRVPELRDAFFHRRYFLSERAARFDAALAGIVMARWAGRPWPLVAAVPYLRTLSRDAQEPAGVQRAGARAAADAVGLLAMLVGSVRYRSLLL